MALSTTAQTFLCDCCDVTYVGQSRDLLGQGWVRHVQRGRSVLLCDLCEAWFEPKWKAQREAA